ncbi:MAG TPA: tetratricopeptide repeat protein [Vicinamibacterales bacterium]|nr:tetratricopeptide repeat protein [Vicinamibacterales bacterium]
MRTRFRSVSAGAAALLLGVALATSACGQYSFSALAAKKAIKEAHELYKASKWKEAAARYEDAVAADPSLSGAHFFLANCYDNLYKPSRAGEPENDAYMQKAIEWYKKAAEKEPDPQFRQRAMQYLVAAYGPDKLNNPAEAEPIVKRMIEMDPNEYLNYLELAKIYENAGRYDEAEAQLLKAREVKPKQPEVYAAISAYYNRQGEFDKTVDALNMAADLQPENPQGYQLVAVFYWEKAYKDKRLTPAQQNEYIAKGIEAANKALKLNPDYVDAMTFKNILLRMQGNNEKDLKKREQLFQEADELRNRATELNKKKVATGK